jgi:hypothetical protein
LRNRDGFGQPGVAEPGGEQGHAAAVLHGLQLADVSGQDDLGAAGAGIGDQVGQVGAGQHRGLVDDEEGAGVDEDRAAGAAAAGQVAQELGGVVRHRNLYGQGVAGGLGRGDADHRAQAGFGPDAGGFGQDAGLAGSGRGVDHRYEPAVGECRERGGGLVLAQPGLRGPRVCVWRGAGECALEARQVGAERVRGLLARQLRRGARAGLRERARLHGELRAGRVPYAAVPLVDAAAVRAPHARRNLGQLWRFQADHWLELGSEYPVR